MLVTNSTQSWEDTQVCSKYRGSYQIKRQFQLADFAQQASTGIKSHRAVRAPRACVVKQLSDLYLVHKLLFCSQEPGCIPSQPEY